MGALLTFLKVMGKIVNILPISVQIAEVIASLVKPGQKTGAEKLAAVEAVIKQTIQASELVIGKDIIDEDLLNQGITKMVNGAVDIMNATRPK
jgi:hypothetical protein